MGLAGAPQANIASWKFGGGIRFYDADDSNFGGFKAASTITGSIDYTLPVAPPVGDGYRLISTTAGIMSWANGANLTASTGISITSGSGTAALLVAATLAIDLAFTPTWTGLHTYITNGVKFNFTNAGDTVISSFVGAASVAALLITTDGSMFWGPGSGAVDVALSRTSAGILNITGNLDISGLTASRILSTNGSGVLTSVGAPASDGYVLSSTTAGVFSWVVNGSPAGANLTASTGLSITAGSGTNALLVAATLAVDQSFTPNWTGLHTFDAASTDFRSTAAATTSPVHLLKGTFKYTGSTYQTLAQITFGKENGSDGNNAGFMKFSTRGNGESMSDRLLLDSAGNLTPSTPDTYSLGSSSARFLGIWSDAFDARLDFNGQATLWTMSNLNTTASSSQTAAMITKFARTGDATARFAAQIIVGKEAEWTGTAGTNDSYFSIELSENASVAERLRLSSAGLLTVPSAKVHAGTSSDRARVGGNLYSDYTDRLSNVGSGAEEDLGSFTVKDGTFVTDGDSLYFSFSGAEGGSGLTKVLKVYVDGVSIYSFTTALTGDWIISLTLVRETSSNLKFSVVRTSVFGGTALSEVLNGDAAYSGAAIVKLTHTTTLTGATPYSTEYFMLCDYMPAA